MAGNVWEWVWGDYAPYKPDPQRDPAGTVTGSGMRVWRGGSWYTEAPRTRVAYRWRSDPNERNADLGFRIARTLTP
jgi:formylglycine-generating enzyme required for sulfatase activity